MFLLNSAKVCRQAPQGGAGLASEVTTAIRTNSRSPAPTAAATADCSAQTVNRKDLFSTLHPVKTAPDLVRSAAPTANFEYGEYAFSRTFMAESISFFISTTYLSKDIYVIISASAETL